ncbi:MAG: DUF4384 domain-containing protein [Planctomycetaceae bacterium]
MNLRMTLFYLIVIGRVGVAMADEPTNGTPPKFPGERLMNAESPFLSGAILGKESAKYTEGELITLTFQSEVDAHLYLLYHQSDGTTLLLYPNPESGNVAIPAETKFQFPSENGKYRFRVQAPFGHEVLQVVASTIPLPELDKLVDAEKKTAPAVSQKLLDELTDRLLVDLTMWSEHRVTLETMAKSK